MKRPLFCVALTFALGEVISLHAGTIGEASIVCTMLAFVVVFYAKKHKPACGCVLAISFLLGAVWAYFGIPRDLVNRDGDLVLREDSYDIVTYKDSGQDSVSVKLAGMICAKDGDTLTLRVLDTDSRDVSVDCVLLRGVTQSFSIGDGVLVSGSYRAFDAVSNPGEFSSAVYYQARGIDGYLYAPEISQFPVCEDMSAFLHGYYRFKDCLYTVRCDLNRRFSELLPEESAAIFAGILLGDKSAISADTKKLYQIGGISHILAISGLHISLIGGLLFRLLKKMRLPVAAAAGFAILFVWIYGIFTGMSLATLRAVLMLAVSFSAQIFGRTYDMPTSMGIALFLMLLVHPIRILDAGMQLSYMAIAGVLLGRAISRRLHKDHRFRHFEKKHPHRFRLVQNLIFSASLNLMMTPVLADAYYVVPVYSWAINLVVIPLMTPVVISGIAGILCSYLSTELAKIMLLPGKWILTGYEFLCRLSAGLPANCIHTGEISDLQYALWYGGILAAFLLLRPPVRNTVRDFFYQKTGRFWQRKQLRIYTVFCLCLLFAAELVGQSVLYVRQRTEAVYFLDVGQGDGILIHSAGGSAVMIDGGSSSRENCGEYVLLPAIRSQGIARIDYWFVTHTDADHISGLTEILEMGNLSQICIGAIVFSANAETDDAMQNIESLAASAGIPILRMQVGDSIGDGTFTLTCLHPDSSYTAADKNAASLALAYHSNALDILFTGDMDADAVTSMRQSVLYPGISGSSPSATAEASDHSGSSPSATAETSDHTGSSPSATAEASARRFDCIKLPHHGSKYSYVEDFYSDATYGIVSCGYHNRYGHPHAEVLDGAAGHGMQIFRTDTQGAVIFRAIF